MAPVVSSQSELGVVESVAAVLDLPHSKGSVDRTKERPQGAD